MSKKNIDTTAILNKGFYCGKYLSPLIKEAVFKRIAELEKGKNPEVWKAYKKGIEIGILDWEHERMKRMNKIKSRFDGLDRSR